MVASYKAGLPQRTFHLGVGIAIGIGVGEKLEFPVIDVSEAAIVVVIVSVIRI